MRYFFATQLFFVHIKTNADSFLNAPFPSPATYRLPTSIAILANQNNISQRLRMLIPVKSPRVPPMKGDRVNSRGGAFSQLA